MTPTRMARGDARTHADLPDPVLDTEPERILEKAVTVGEERLSRSPFDVGITALIGGVEVSLGGMAAAVVLSAGLKTGSLNTALALAALVFPVGFVFVIIRRSELFTENFLIPVVAVTNGNKSLVALLRLWLAAWIGNIAGCTALAALLSVPHAIGKPVVAAYVTYTSYKLGLPPVATFTSAVLAGVVMTLLTWLLVAVRSVGAKIALIWAAGYTLFAANLSHVIVGSSLLFVGLGGSGHGLGDLLAWLGLATAGNLVGGLGFVTLFRVVQTWEKKRR